ncbi:MAG: hypothetical protein R3A10_10650 [Caldilineaceae bacterium]
MTNQPSGPFAGLDPAQLEAMLHQMLLIRAFEKLPENSTSRA